MRCCWDTLCITFLISLHCEFPLEEDLRSSLLFTISELGPVQHQRAAMTLNTACRVPGRVGDWCSLWGWHYYCSLVRSPFCDRQPCKWTHAITPDQTTVPHSNSMQMYKPLGSGMHYFLFVYVCVRVYLFWKEREERAIENNKQWECVTYNLISSTFVWHSDHPYQELNTGVVPCQDIDFLKWHTVIRNAPDGSLFAQRHNLLK